MAVLLKKLFRRAYDILIEPRSTGVDQRRRESILNLLLSGMIFVSTLALLSTVDYHFTSSADRHVDSLIATLTFWLITLGLLVLSRHGKSSLSALLFLIFLMISGLEFALMWGFGIADAELILALNIVIAGVLFAAPMAIYITALTSVLLVGVAYLQVERFQIPETYWRSQPFQFDDAIGFIVIFAVIGLVSWLSNSEIDRSLKRARTSERELQEERDGLELKVIDRTRELEELQLARLLELQPFAEIGWISAGLVHEIANPLTAASLYLEELNRQQHSVLVRQAQRSLQKLDEYLLAARKQIKRESELKNFSVGSEIRQVCELLRKRARDADAKLSIGKIRNIRLYGDSVKFNQIIANVLANAIDSVGLSAKGNRVVTCEAWREDNWIKISVDDNGPGILKIDNMDDMFKPFVTTKKSSPQTGLGIGLALVKQYTEVDFNGSVSIETNEDHGTRFILKLQDQNKT